MNSYFFRPAGIAFFVILNFALAVCSANADLVVTMNVTEVTLGTGTFEVLLSLPANDVDNGMNAGVASYNVPLLNVATVDHNSPQALDGTTGGLVAFRGFGRSSDDDATLSASQDTINASGIVIYNMGIAAGDLGAGLFLAEQPIYSAPLQIATGTWSGSVPAFDSGISINLFNPAMDKSTFAATSINPVVNLTAVPEPSAFALVGLLGIAFAGRTRLLRLLTVPVG